MASGASRYFAGQAPAGVFFDSDDSDNDDAQSAPSGPPDGTKETSSSAPEPLRRRRRRIEARVVTTGSEQPEKAQRNAADTGFVPVKSLTYSNSAALDKDRRSCDASPLPTTSSSSDDSSASSSSNHGEDSASWEATGEHDGDRNASFADEEEEKHPVFLHPDLFATRCKREEEEQRAEEWEAKRDQIRRDDAQALVKRALEEEERCRDIIMDGDQIPDDEDRPEDHDADHALWKVREILRVQRDREEQRDWETRGSASGNRTSVSNVKCSRKAGDSPPLESIREASIASKPEILQRYYKVGPFFMEKNSDGRYSEDIYNRDYNQATNADAVNRSA